MKQFREHLAALRSVIRSAAGEDGELTRAFESLCEDLERSHSELDSARRYTDQMLRIEKEARHTHKLEALGRLTGGISHEINNPLNYLLGNLALARRRIAGLTKTIGRQASEELEELLGDAADGADRIRRIVGDVKSFARADEGEVGAADVGPSMHTAIKMAGGALRHGAHLITDIDELPAVHADRRRLEQVFLNLLLNAAQAFATSDEKNEIRVTASRQLGDVVAIEIEDNGCGMPRETVEHIFEPFYTTKVGEGTGLGLFICHGIIQSFGGRITIESEQGVGTIVRINLPVATQLAEELTPIPDIVAGTEPFDGHALRVLVVDDEPRVANVLARMIGDDTDVAGNAQEALVMHQEHAYDVVLCDLMMPDMSGIDFYRAMSRLGPGHKERIVFLTGGAFTPAAESFLGEVPNTCLEKPVAAEELRRVVDAHAIVGRNKA